MKQLLISIVLVAALLLGWLATMDRYQEREPVIPGVEAEGPVLRSEELAVPDTIAAEESQSAAAIAKSSRKEVALPEAPTPMEAEIPQLLRGAVILVDSNGAGLPPGSGELTLLAWQGRIGRDVKVAVRDGEWKVVLQKLEGAERLSVGSISIEGERFVLDSPEGPFALPDDLFVEIAAHRRRGTTLHVVDAATDLDLSGVRLARDRSGGRAFHPGSQVEGKGVRTGLRSPIALQAEFTEKQLSSLGRGHLFVVADGYAWAPVKIDLDAGGEYRVALRPGADLEVTLIGYDPASKAELRLYGARGDRPVTSRIRSGEDPIQVSGLPAGLLSVRIEIGKWYSEPLVLGEVQVELTAGELAYATVEIEAAPVVEYVSIAGTIHVPDAWEIEEVLVRMHFLGTALAGFDDRQALTIRESTASSRPGYHAFAWSFDRMLIGKYELGSRDPGYSIIIDVPTGGRDDYVLELPPPAELLVEVVEEVSGAPVQLESLGWHAERPEGVPAIVESAEFDEELGVFHIIAPATRIWLTIGDWGYVPVGEPIELIEGTTHHTLRLRRASTIEISMVDGDTPVSIPDGSVSSPEPAEGNQGRVVASRPGEFSWSYQVNEPGRYFFDVPEIPGYAKPERLEIDVLEWETVKCVVELERQ
jgi:hypothetical protein